MDATSNGSAQGDNSATSSCVNLEAEIQQAARTALARTALINLIGNNNNFTFQHQTRQPQPTSSQDVQSSQPYNNMLVSNGNSASPIAQLNQGLQSPYPGHNGHNAVGQPQSMSYAAPQHPHQGPSYPKNSMGYNQNVYNTPQPLSQYLYAAYSGQAGPSTGPIPHAGTGHPPGQGPGSQPDTAQADSAKIVHKFDPASDGEKPWGTFIGTVRNVKVHLGGTPRDGGDRPEHITHIIATRGSALSNKQLRAKNLNHELVNLQLAMNDPPERQQILFQKICRSAKDAFKAEGDCELLVCDSTLR